MAEFFETKIENSEKSIPLCVPSRNKEKLCEKESCDFQRFKDENLDKKHNGKKFCKVHGMCGHTTD